MHSGGCRQGKLSRDSELGPALLCPGCVLKKHQTKVKADLVVRTLDKPPTDCTKNLWRQVRTAFILQEPCKFGLSDKAMTKPSISPDMRVSRKVCLPAIEAGKTIVPQFPGQVEIRW